MNYDDLKEQLIEKFDELKDSELFQTAGEKYQALTPNIQKLIIWLGIGSFTVIMFGCFGPVGYLSESSDYVEIYEQKRDQIRDLLIAKQKENQTSRVPQQMSSEQFKNSVQSALSGASLLPEQQVGVTPFDVSASSMRPKKAQNIQQEGLEVKLQKLNLNQIIKIGYDLESINEAVKLAGVDIAATAEDDHYFDVNYRLIRFSLDTTPTTPPDEKKRGKRGTRKKKDK